MQTELTIIKGTHGYLIRPTCPDRYITSTELWAYSTLDEVRKALPGLFEPKPKKAEKGKA